MKIYQTTWSVSAQAWNSLGEVENSGNLLVFLFAARSILEQAPIIERLKEMLPDASLVGCSTSGEILGVEVHDDSAVATIMDFESTTFRISSERFGNGSDSFEIGKRLIEALPKETLRHVFIFAPGLHVNGSMLAAGVNQARPPGVSVTGGLAGDGALFAKTLTVSNSGVYDDQCIAVGLYGDSLEIGHSSIGGWENFGPSRKVTKSSGNVLYELDGKSALDIYKNYLGEHAKDLPSSGLLFPLSIKLSESHKPLVRTILAVNENEQSITFAGDVPQGAIAQMMHANFDRLIQGAHDAASTSVLSSDVEFSLLISCVGRKLVLKQRTEEEVEVVQEVLGSNSHLTGFYSYGEISTSVNEGNCELHNQTMTITTLRERSR